MMQWKCYHRRKESACSALELKFQKEEADVISRFEGCHPNYSLCTHSHADALSFYLSDSLLCQHNTLTRRLVIIALSSDYRRLTFVLAKVRFAWMSPECVRSSPSFLTREGEKVISDS
jgi:hypothetical protein